MAENDSSKSMDDVLASIRRIVRAEREADDVGPDEALDVSDEQQGSTGDAPLALTPDMMSDADEVGSPPAGPVPVAVGARAQSDLFRDPGVEDIGNTIGDARPRASDLATFVNAPEPVEADPVAPPPVAPPAISDDTLREMVREVLREEFAHGEAEGRVREIIKAELTTGEIGANISRNVLRLIRSEVAKANG